MNYKMLISINTDETVRGVTGIKFKEEKGQSMKYLSMYAEFAKS